MINNRSRYFCVGIIATVAFTACSDATEPEGEAPDLPPQTSFVIDFSDFASPQLAASQGFQTAPAVGTVWTRSAAVVGVWNLLITGTLAPPVAAFVASFNHTPEWDNDAGAWVWSYDFSALGAQHSARLEGRLVTDGVQWDMYITRDGSFEDFHWYTGLSHVSGTSGTWSLYREPDDPGDFLDIEWNRTASGETHDITYTNVVAGTAEYGSYITYGVTEDTPYGAYYHLYAAESGNLTEIEWNRTTKEGRTRDPAYFQDSNWHCWDVNLDNTECQ